MSKKATFCIIVLFISALILKNIFVDETVSHHILNTAFEGRIENHFKDASNKNGKCVIVNNNRYSVYNDALFETMSEGDTIIKKINTLKYILIHNGDTILYFPLDTNGEKLKE